MGTNWQPGAGAFRFDVSPALGADDALPVAYICPQELSNEFFPSAKFKMVKAIKRQIPQHHRAVFNGTTILITTQIPALRHNRVDTGFDWYEFGKLVKSHYDG